MTARLMPRLMLVAAPSWTIALIAAEHCALLLESGGHNPVLRKLQGLPELKQCAHLQPGIHTGTILSSGE